MTSVQSDSLSTDFALSHFLSRVSVVQSFSFMSSITQIQSVSLFYSSSGILEVDVSVIAIHLSLFCLLCFNRAEMSNLLSQKKKVPRCSSISDYVICTDLCTLHVSHRRTELLGYHVWGKAVSDSRSVTWRIQSSAHSMSHSHSHPATSLLQNARLNGKTALQQSCTCLQFFAHSQVRKKPSPRAQNSTTCQISSDTPPASCCPAFSLSNQWQRSWWTQRTDRISGQNCFTTHTTFAMKGITWWDPTE